MEKIVSNLIDVIDQYKDQPEQLEVEMKVFYDAHQNDFESLSESINTKMQAAMAKVDPMDFQAAMGTMFEVISSIMGADNFNRMMAIQQSHPHLNQLIQSVIPIKK